MIISAFGRGWDQLATVSILELEYQEFIMWERNQGRFFDPTSAVLRGDWLAKVAAIAIKNRNYIRNRQLFEIKGTEEEWPI